MITVFLRAIFLYILVIFALRLMGKRQLGELQPTELVIAILVSNIASLPIEDPDIPMVVGAIPIFVLVGFEIIISDISLRSNKFRRFISGNPVVVISDGKIIQKALHKLRFSVEDLIESLREQGIFYIDDVHFAIVETTGKISVLPKFEKQNATPENFNIKGDSINPPILIISDGRLIESALTKYDISKQWLDNILKKQKLSTKQIFLMTVDKSLKYYIVKKEGLFI